MQIKRTMSRKLTTAAVIAGGALTAVTLPAGTAYAATPKSASNPGLAVPDGKLAAPHAASGTPKAPAAASSSCGNTVTWQDRYDNRYLEVYHSSTANGAWVDAYPGNGTCTQQWYAVLSGFASNGYGYTHDLYGMVDANSDKCLAAPTSNIGNAHVVQESCGYSSYNYRWAESSVYNKGWVLNEVPNGWYTSSGIAACEDVSNHWIYTSYFVNHTTDVPASTYSNCIWH